MDCADAVGIRRPGMSRLVIDWQPPTIEVAGEGRFPVRQVWLRGPPITPSTAREMGADPEQSPAGYFSARPAQALTNNAGVDYPSETDELHHEVGTCGFSRKRAGAGCRLKTGRRNFSVMRSAWI